MLSKFVGNSYSMKVHAVDCPYAVQIHPDSFELFDDLHVAIQQEYEECGWCMGEARESEYRRSVVAQFKQEVMGGDCIACGASRGIQRAHIVPRRHGGKETMPLCPSCHWNYDHDLLQDKEARKINTYLRTRRKELRTAIGR